LRKAGYATSTTYAQALIKLVVENDLQQYTLAGLGRLDMRDDLFTTGNLAVKEDGKLSEIVEEPKAADKFLTNVVP
jgi:hypothetical protein